MSSILGVVLVFVVVLALVLALLLALVLVPVLRFFSVVERSRYSTGVFVRRSWFMYRTCAVWALLCGHVTQGHEWMLAGMADLHLASI